jgi:hypothetical protein
MRFNAAAMARTLKDAEEISACTVAERRISRSFYR